MNDGKQQPGFLFHDYETFGTHPALDRPAQFAAIRTDNDFNIIGEPEVFYCKPADDYLPQPEAVLITVSHRRKHVKRERMKPLLLRASTPCSPCRKPVSWAITTCASMMR
jgi:exonuclease I